MAVLLTLADVTWRYGVSRVTIHTWRRAGKFPAPLLLPGKHPRWREADLLAWERQLTPRAADPKP